MALLHESETLITAEELAHLPDLGPCELVNGKIVRLSPARPLHGIVELRLGAAMLAYADKSERGIVMSGEVGLVTRHNPDTVRGADLVFMSHGRYARRGSASFLEVPPELVVEVLSPDDRRGEVEEKLAEYLAMGVDLVWVVDPKSQYVLAYRSMFEVERFEVGDLLADEEILPGFSVPVADLFRK